MRKTITIDTTLLLPNTDGSSFNGSYILENKVTKVRHKSGYDIAKQVGKMLDIDFNDDGPSEVLCDIIETHKLGRYTISYDPANADGDVDNYGIVVTDLYN